MNSNTYPSITVIPLGFRDMEAPRAFYVEGLGFPLLWSSAGQIAFVRAGPGQMPSLWGTSSMPEEYGDVGHGGAGSPGLARTQHHIGSRGPAAL
ncbi:hypothetical protein GCM10023166_33700 [Paeniglutamicibacter cryotolerans]